MTRNINHVCENGNVPKINNGQKHISSISQIHPFSEDTERSGVVEISPVEDVINSQNIKNTSLEFR